MGIKLKQENIDRLLDDPDSYVISRDEVNEPYEKEKTYNKVIKIRKTVKIGKNRKSGEKS